jgi:hypothetical protein
MTKKFICPFESQKCETIPDVIYKNKWHVGGTGYIDGISPKDDVFNTAPVVKFIDEFGRSAIAFKYTVSCPENLEENNSEYAVAAFQRYTNDGNVWVYGGHYAHGTATNMGKPDFSWLESLILNNQEKFTNYNYKKYIEEKKDFETFLCNITLAGVTQLHDVTANDEL